MAKLKKICNSKFDLDKPVIIAGKGPSLSNIDDFLKGKKLNDFYFCAVNSAYQCLPRTDFLSFCDLEILDVLDENDREDYKKIKNLVCPLVLRYSVSPGMVIDSDKTYKWLLNRLEGVNVNIYNFKLFTQHLFLQFDDEVDDFYFKGTGEKAKLIPPADTITSSYQCGLLWLTKAGFRNFHIFGVSQQREYHELFVENNDCGNARDDNWYIANSLKGESILEEYNCTYQYH